MRRYLLICINIISVIVAICSLVLLSARVGNSNLYDILGTTSYIDTEDFKIKTEKKIHNAFACFCLKRLFEDNGILNFDKVVARTTEKIALDGFERTSNDWTLGYCMRRAGYYGVYIDENYNVIQYQNISSTISNYEKNKNWNFEFITFDDREGPVVMTELDFLKELYSHLSDYYNYSIDLLNGESNFKYIITYLDKSNFLVNRNTEKQIEELINTDKYLYASTETNRLITNLNIDTSEVFSLITQTNPFDLNSQGYICCSVDTRFLEDDNYRVSYLKFDRDKQVSSLVGTIWLFCTIIFIVTLIMIVMSIARYKKKIVLNKNALVNMPVEVIVVFYILFIYVVIVFLNYILRTEVFINVDVPSISTYIYAAVIYNHTLLFLTLMFYKAEHGYFDDDVFKQSIVGRSLVFVNKVLENTSIGFVIMLLILPLFVLLFVSIALIYSYLRTNSQIVLLLGISIIVSIIIIITFMVVINKFYILALEERTKANNMRTALITNVSHDIRTPLTSIINYSDLMQRELDNKKEPDKERLLHFSKILTDKSNRLKDLMDDLLFVSKTSSHSIEMVFSIIDINEFVEQVLVEFEHRFKELNLKLVKNISDKKYFIEVDSEQLYRVFQNLFSNICKYALENTRVYVDVKKINDKIHIDIKNISKEKILVDANSLKDRFIRGSEARDTDGFGLGLAIADDLVKSMNGSLNLDVDGDLYKAELIFYEKTSKKNRI